MELRHLKYFVAVAEEENITRAAARLHVSQPPLSRQIRDLEEELNLELFDRRPQSITLTAAGKLFLAEAIAVLERAEQAMQLAATLSSKGRAEIHIGYAPSLTVDILPHALRRFQLAAEGVRVRLRDLSTEEMLHSLGEQKLDIALMIRPARIKMLKGLEFKPLRRYAVCLAMHPTHPLARSSQIGLSKVVNERLITYSREDYPEYHAWLEKLCQKHSFAPQICEEHDSSTSLIASVEAGRGVALVQQGFEGLSGSRLVLKPLKPAPAPFVVGVAWRTGHVDAVVSTFLKALEDCSEKV